MRAPFRWWVLTGVGGTRRFVLLDFRLVLRFHPISLVLPKETGWSPKEIRFLGWWRPREVSGPARLSHSRGSCHSAAKVSASRTDWITRRHGEGLGSDVDWRLKVFCPAFLQKSGRGPGAEPLDARRSARNAPCASQSAGGGQRGNPRRGFPLCGRLRRPQPARHRGADGHPTPGGDGTPPLRGGLRNVVGSAVAEGKGRRGRRPLRRVGDGPRSAGFTAILSHARAGVGGTRRGRRRP